MCRVAGSAEEGWAGLQGVRRKAGQGCRECGGRLGRVAASMGEGWGGLQGVRRKAGQGCRVKMGRLQIVYIVVGRERFGGSLFGKYVRIRGEGEEDVAV